MSSLARSLDLARARDAADPLQSYRDRFHLPTAADGRPLTYLCGHSLGLAPLRAREYVAQELDDWARLGVMGHHVATRPWVGYADHAKQGLAVLAGAQPVDVVAMNSLTANLHLMLTAFYRPHGARTRILIEAGAFSSDRHAVASQIAWHGLEPAAQLVELEPDPRSGVFDEAAIEAAIAREGERLALVLWPGVQYRTGQAFDNARIARAAHAVGALAGFDHAHAIGNLPLTLAADEADFAVWCCYKYLNAGPGAIGGCFVHPRHTRDDRQRGLEGWWGHDAATRFQMDPGFVAEAGAAGFALSNPPILSTAPLLASLELFAAADIVALRRKSVELTAFLEALIRDCAGSQLRVLTPQAPRQRGAQLSLQFAGGGAHARAVFERLAADGLVCDLREPDILRVAPVPLYNRCEDAWRFAASLETALRHTG
ncbi:MAG: kynureninase [Steroidobacteraceae bacterium]|nr:kynureninase [Nevskiaceae bacterium]MCP5360522.1 kynureninase [Nevskiaceae bacterium]MCP5472868.1 kynureninase [Nevskiaceae bacterium]